MRQTARLKRLVEQLLDCVRLNAAELPLQRAPIDLVALCRDVADMTMATDGPRAVIDGDPSVIGRWDAVRLEQVVTNLLSNAVRYSRSETPVRVTIRRAGQHALLRVSDEGIGIPAKQIDQLFRPFFRASTPAKSRRAGSGPAHRHEIVRRHGGLIRVESRENLGTTFTVELPVEAQQQGPLDSETPGRQDAIDNGSPHRARSQSRRWKWCTPVSRDGE